MAAHATGRRLIRLWTLVAVLGGCVVPRPNGARGSEERASAHPGHVERVAPGPRHADDGGDSGMYPAALGGTEGPPGTSRPQGHPPSSALERLLDEAREATARYRDPEVARADGFVRFGRQDAPLMGEHWYRRDRVGEAFDHRRPSTLQYAVIRGERVLVGVAYGIHRSPDEPLPDVFPGFSHAWHVHDLEKIARTMTEGRPLLRHILDRRLKRSGVGRGGRTQLTMVHAWIWVENPDFVLAHEHRALPYLRAGLPASWAEGAGLDAANGVALLDDVQCLRERRMLTWIARADRTRASTLAAACAAAEARVRGALSWAADPATLNTEAAAAWRSYDRLKAEVLLPEHHARLAAWIDHPGGH